MKIIRSRYVPFGHFSAINLLGVLFVHPGVYLSQELLNHERIHTRQMLELAIVPFYIAYVLEWLVRLPMRGNAYRNISFEREAYAHEREADYLARRRPYAWLRTEKDKPRKLKP
ncbi:MAG: hypothetical protein IJT30_01285 [Muribaculaceae bacterium]|nr:hypothetical protein [Muribaculaceae bacterium]